MHVRMYEHKSIHLRSSERTWSLLFLVYMYLCMCVCLHTAAHTHTFKHIIEHIIPGRKGDRCSLCCRQLWQAWQVPFLHVRMMFRSLFLPGKSLIMPANIHEGCHNVTMSTCQDVTMSRHHKPSPLALSYAPAIFHIHYRCIKSVCIRRKDTHTHL